MATTRHPLVSIIIPCYNYAEYLEGCVQSVLAQTHPELEIIIINDGSTDETEAVAQKLAEREPRITYIAQKNQGIVATRNTGVKAAKGEYLLQLDADDWLEPNYIEATLAVMKHKKADIAYTQAELFGRTSFTTEYPDFNLEYLKHDNFIHASALVRRSVFEGRLYDTYLSDKGYEDWDLFLDACMEGATAALTTETKLHYRKHDANRPSRSDNLHASLHDLLARHHILSKQNAKHPEQMWYLSSLITTLQQAIDLTFAQGDLTAELERTKLELDKSNLRIQEIESSRWYKAYAKARKYI